MDNKDQQLWDLLGEAGRRHAPEGFTRSVMEQIALEQQQPARTSWFCLSWFDKIKDARFSYAVTAGAAAVLCLLLVLTRIEPSQDPASLAVEVDDEILLDLAFQSLGQEELQNAVYEIASIDARPIADRELAEMIFNG